MYLHWMLVYTQYNHIAEAGKDPPKVRKDFHWCNVPLVENAYQWDFGKPHILDS